MQRPARWSKKTDELVRYVAQRCRPAFQSELGRWLEESSRFRTFLAANQDKVRKKLTSSDDENSRMDVRAELLVAYLILADRRFELAFEAYGAHQLGPDFSVTFRANQRFNLEVTRLRLVSETRLVNVIAGKLRQLPGDMPNALLVTAPASELGEEGLATAVRQIKLRSDAKEVPPAQFRNLSGVFVLDEAQAPLFAANREARHPLPRESVLALALALHAAQPNAGDRKEGHEHQ